MATDTGIQEHPQGMPTLVYNCAKLPGHLHKYQSRKRFLSRTSSWRRSWETYQRPLDASFRYRQSKEEVRRNLACPDNWREGRDCPETNPPQPNTVPNGTSLEEGAYPARPFMPARQGKQRGDKGWNTIADDDGQAAGLVSWYSISAFKGPNAYISCTFYSMT